MFEVLFPGHLEDLGLGTRLSYLKFYGGCIVIHESSVVPKYTALYHPQACMFVNISPLESNVPETVSTLEFGQNARQVELGKATKHVTRHAV